MTIRKYRVFNHSKKKFEIIYTSVILEVAQFINLPQGELQVFEELSSF